MDSNSNGQEVCLGCLPKPNKCPKCEEEFPSKTKFNAHRATCKKYKCEQCDLRFINENELKAHAKTHRLRFPCDLCTETFSTQDVLDGHKFDDHGIPLTCPYCPRTFKRADKRKEHVNTHDPETANKCVCGVIYVKKSQLKDHEKECVVTKDGGKAAVKRKFSDLVEKNPDGDKSALALDAFNMVRKEAEKRIRMTCCGTAYTNEKCLKKHIREKHSQSQSSVSQSQNIEKSELEC